MHKLFQIETIPTIGSLQVISRDERIEKPSNKDAKPVASDSNFELLLIEDSSEHTNTDVHTSPHTFFLTLLTTPMWLKAEESADVSTFVF